MLERPDAGDAGNAGDAGEVCEDAEDVGGDAGDCPGQFAVFTVFFEGRATWHQKPVARPGRPGMFWGPSVWAGLRAGDAGNAEEELGVKQNTSV